MHLTAQHAELVVDHAHDVALMDLLALVGGVAHGVGDGRGVHVLGGLGHGLGVLLHAHVGGEGQHRGDSHGHGLGGQNDHVLLRQLRGLLGREDDVGVVGQDEHVSGVGGLHRLGQILNAGIHGLSAVHDLIHHQILEDAVDALAQRNGHDAVVLQLGGLRLGGSLPLGLALAGLLEHVVHLDGVQLAQLQRILHGLAGVVGVHVHLHHGQIGDDQHAVADLLQALAQAHDLALLHVRTRVGDDELRAVAECNVLHAQVAVIVHVFAGHGLRRAAALLDLHRLAGEGGVHAAEDDHQAHAAAVHHAGLLEHRQHLRRLLQDRVAGGEQQLEQLLEGLALAAAALQILGDHADHGEDRALLGLHHGLVGGVCALADRLNPQRAVHVLVTGQAAGDAAQNLAENDAGVAARTLQRAARDGVRHICGGGIALGVHFLDGGGDGLGHVGARIAVRNREHIQGIDALAVLRQQRSSRGEHLLEHHAIYLLIRHFFLQLWGRLSDADVLDAYVDAPNLNPRKMFHLVFHGLDDRSRDRTDRNAVFHDDEQVDVHLVAGCADFHASSKIFLAHQLHNAVR